MEILRDIEAKAQIQGVQIQIIKFDFLFGIILGEIILRLTDNLSRAKVTAVEGQQIADIIVQTLQKLESGIQFILDESWQNGRVTGS